MSFTLAIVGRPNVGKSTLFNRLVGQRLALVDDMPGVTRDRREGRADLAGLEFTVIDTAGLEEADEGSLAARMREQTNRAISDADVVMMVIDGRAGVTPLDHHFAELIRRQRAPVLLVVNKSEGKVGMANAYEAYELGLGDPIAISAEHGEGMGDLFDALRPFSAREQAMIDDPDQDDTHPAESEPDSVKPLLLAICGRPNVGKSTLVNRLLGEERLLTGPEAGITRDSISVDWEWNGRAVRLVDTAGLRRKTKVEGKLESLSTNDTIRAIRFAELVILVLDSTLMLEKQDLAIARLVESEGRAMVIAINKWDLIQDKTAALHILADRLQISMSQLAGIACVPLSAVTGAGLDKLMQTVFNTYEIWNKRVGTPLLNRWLASVQERHPPPLVDGRRLKLRYMTQANTRPPTFALFSSKPGELPDAYKRYLINLLRDNFDLQGVPIRLMLRGSSNPFDDKTH